LSQIHCRPVNQWRVLPYQGIRHRSDRCRAPSKNLRTESVSQNRRGMLPAGSLAVSPNSKSLEDGAAFCCREFESVPQFSSSLSPKSGGQRLKASVTMTAAGFAVTMRRGSPRTDTDYCFRANETIYREMQRNAAGSLRVSLNSPLSYPPRMGAGG